MSSFGEVTLGEVWAMLEACAKGHTKVEYKHSYCVRFNNLTYPALPTGRHGTGDNRTIQKGHLKKMARHLGILDCAKTHLNLQ